jgi:hypothetical protein
MRHFTAILAVLLFFCSCKKHETNTATTVSVKDSIVMGDYSGMLVNKYDTLLDLYKQAPVSFNLSLGNDGIYNYNFYSYTWSLASVGVHSRTYLSCTDANSFLFGYSINDTSFMHFSKTIVSAGPPVKIEQVTTYSCQRTDATDKIDSLYLNHFRIKPLSQGDWLSAKPEYRSDTITLVDDPYDFSGTFTQNDTIHNFSIYDQQDCNLFPAAQVKYIGIKITNGSTSKLGWIKLNILDNFRISIIESAIQK